MTTPEQSRAFGPTTGAVSPAVPPPADGGWRSARERVPYRTIAATIGMILLTLLVLKIVELASRVLIWTLIAAFFAVALAPLAARLDRVLGGRRWLSTLLVFLGVAVVLAALVAVFVLPLSHEGADLAKRAPGLYDDATHGRGPAGELIRRYDLADLVAKNRPKIEHTLTSLGTPAIGAVRTAGTVVAAFITIFVLAYLMVLEGPKLVDGTIALLPADRQHHVRTVAADCARTVTGYISGNLLISVICGLLTWIVLLIMGVPFAGLIALFVALADLVPLVGATIGAVIATIAAFFVSVPAGIVVIVFFLVYQQAENHLLQPVILSRTVKLNPLTVLFSILLAVELAGILGALLAIPVAGILQVIVRDVWDSRRGRPKPAPTVGEDETPVAARGVSDSSSG